MLSVYFRKLEDLEYFQPQRHDAENINMLNLCRITMCHPNIVCKFYALLKTVCSGKVAWYLFIGR